MNNTAAPTQESNKQGILVLVVGATASGKGELIRHIKETYSAKSALRPLAFPISCVTRPMRSGEKEGENYHYISIAEFDERIQRGDFLEWVEKDGGVRYGTLKADFVGPIDAGAVVVREVDKEGVIAIEKQLPQYRIIVIMIDGGGWNEVYERMQKRSPVTQIEAEHRRKRFEIEDPFFRAHAHHIINNHNGNLLHAKEAMYNIIETIRNK